MFFPPNHQQPVFPIQASILSVIWLFILQYKVTVKLALNMLKSFHYYTGLRQIFRYPAHSYILGPPRIGHE